MHVHEAMVNVVGNDLKCAHIVFKRGRDIFSEAINGNRGFKKRLIQNILPDMIINALDIGGKSIMLDFKSLCSSRNAYKHSQGKFGKGVEV
jgi:hypothetical protein